LYEAIRRHYLTFLAEADATDCALPPFVTREFDKYLDCGILGRGFVRCRCPSCGCDRLVAFSCKTRGWCPACIGRRMADTAAYLSDHVVPDIPMRSWTLTFPSCPGRPFPHNLSVGKGISKTWAVTYLLDY